MSKARQIRSYDNVNQPYEKVREALGRDSLGVFRRATAAASDRAESLASTLRVSIGALEVATEIDFVVSSIDERERPPETRIHLEWKVSQAPRLFPFMKATLGVYPLTSTETQLDFYGEYRPPLSGIGGALDAVAGHRVAEASVHGFVKDVARHLRTELAG